MNKTVRLRINEILKEREMTQEELATRAGISRVSANKLANNPRQIRFETLGLLMSALELPLEGLFAVEE